MKRVLFLLFLWAFIFIPAPAQQIVRTTGEAQAELTRDKSRHDAEAEARQMATVNALEKAFGRVVVQGNATYIRNLNTGETTETRSVFNMIANTSVKGEVVEVIGEAFSDVNGYKIVNGEKIEVVEVRCEITLRAREITTPPIQFESFPLACLHIRCKSAEYAEGDTLYFHFRSPVSGYLTIFLDDGEWAFRLLPYQAMAAEYENGVPVQADREYLFFSDRPEYNYFGDDNAATDIYTLTAESMEVINRLTVIFSKKPINKPELDTDLDDKFLTREEINKKYRIPKGLPSEDFQEWLIENRSYQRENMQVDLVDLRIRKK